MFNSPNNKEKTTTVANTIISEGVFIEGTFSGFKGPLFIDGRVQGNIETKHNISIGEKGIVKGEILCQGLDISGKFEGNVISKTVNIYKTGKIIGDVITNELVCESGGKFIGHMKDSSDNQWDIIDSKIDNKSVTESKKTNVKNDDNKNINI